MFLTLYSTVFQSIKLVHTFSSKTTPARARFGEHGQGLCVFRKIKGWVIFEHSLMLFKKEVFACRKCGGNVFAVPKWRLPPFRRILFIKSAERLIFLHFAAYSHSFCSVR